MYHFFVLFPKECHEFCFTTWTSLRTSWHSLYFRKLRPRERFPETVNLVGKYPVYHSFIRSVIEWNFLAKTSTCFVFSPVPTYYLPHGGIFSIYYYELSNSAGFGLFFPFWARTWKITTCSTCKGLKRFKRENILIRAFYTSPPFLHS